VLIILIFYFNFLLFESYLRLIVWAILFSQALRQAKNNVISVLQYLSDDPDVERNVRFHVRSRMRPMGTNVRLWVLYQGFLTSVFSKSREILLYQPGRGARRTGKELFLNYGIFVFSLIGAVSIWMRMYSMVSFLHVGLGVWVLLLSVIKILDRRIFYYRYFISDDVLVSLLLILGFFVTVRTLPNASVTCICVSPFWRILCRGSSSCSTLELRVTWKEVERPWG
jgi:hypothetical protein